MTKIKSIIHLLLVCSLFPGVSCAEIILNEEYKFKIISDFRLRYENDWDSENAGGVPREDRERLRIRARLGAEMGPLTGVTIGARLRTGAKDSQQSPHVTIIDFDDNPVGDQDAVFDKWFVRYTKDTFSIWGGRNSLPFWKQNELFWDDDATPAGVAGAYVLARDYGKFSFNAGIFKLPDGAEDFNGNLAAGQVVYSSVFKHVDFLIAGGLFAIDGETGSENLLNGNGGRDYTLWVGNAQVKINDAPFPVTLGLDIMHNSEDYSLSDSDPFTVTNRNQNDGYVISLLAGKSKNPGDFLAGYYFAHIETLAVNASFAQDDWMRWGTANQTAASNFKGHEFRMGVTLTKKLNLLARLYLVDSLTSVEDGKRFRVDLNYEF